ncbi:hypothetical protein T484DRAFT_1781921 [Baffinella frigidus]|nr:hypothetical protein T484DRAFT_1781921 [Cryptophyta sp. CCMP2293]
MGDARPRSAACKTPRFLPLLALLVGWTLGDAPRAAGGGGEAGPSVRLIRPSDLDFVEALRGGELASDVVFDIQGFVVPRDGYLEVRFGDDYNAILCPKSVGSVAECPSGEEELKGVVRVSLYGMSLGEQEIT